MDVAPRAAFLAAVILPQERTAVMGLLNVVKTFAQCLSPLIVGFLASKNSIGWSFVLAGTLKASYDLGILYMFVGRRTREEVAEEERRGRSRHGREDEEDGVLMETVSVDGERR